MADEIAAVEGGATPASRFLVVDDDPVTGGMVRFRLESFGYQGGSAASGEEALDRLGTLDPDLTFLDIAMPGMDGLEVLESVRERGLDAAVVMMTAHGTEQVAVEARGAAPTTTYPSRSSQRSSRPC